MVLVLNLPNKVTRRDRETEGREGVSSGGEESGCHGFLTESHKGGRSLPSSWMGGGKEVSHSETRGERRGRLSTVTEHELLFYHKDLLKKITSGCLFIFTFRNIYIRKYNT